MLHRIVEAMAVKVSTTVFAVREEVKIPSVLGAAVGVNCTLGLPNARSAAEMFML
jgi:hypothetical protein